MEKREKATPEQQEEFLNEIRRTVGQGTGLTLGAAQKVLDTMHEMAVGFGLGETESQALMVQIAMETSAQLIVQANERNNKLGAAHKAKGCCPDKPFNSDEATEKLIIGIAQKAPALNVIVTRREA